MNPQQKQQYRPQYQTSGDLRIIPLGGLEEIGRNMVVIEYKDDIIIIDAGLQFPEENMPGIDYIIPNTKYLEKRKDKIRGLIITHGHYDHIGAIPHIMDKIGNPPIFAAPLTKAVILKRQEDYPNSPKLEIHEAKDGTKLRLGDWFDLEFFSVTHNIPDALGAVIKTPIGNIVHPGEFKFDYGRDEKPIDIQKFEEIGKKNILLLMLDSTRAEETGKSVPEYIVKENLKRIFQISKGRIIVGTFASLLDRVQQIMSIAEEMGKKVAIRGYSMKMNVEIAKNLGYLKFDKQTLIPIEKSGAVPDEKLVVLCTGAQGEASAALMRIASGEDKYIRTKRGDTIVFSSSIIPGNERSVQMLRDNLTRQGAKVYHYKMMDIHSSGHATRPEMQEIIKMIKPKFFMPIHGYYYMRNLLGEAAADAGVNPKNIIIADNGNILEVNQNQARISKKKAASNYIMVDGLGVGDVGNVVLRDRQVMSNDGMFVIIAIVDSKTGKVKGSPDIISRGFVYLKESKELLHGARKKIRQIVESATRPGQPVNDLYIKNNIREKIGQYLYSKTQRRPMVLPVIIEI